MNNTRKLTVDEEIGLRLRQVRKASKWTGKDIAEAIGITYQQISKYEAGRNRLSFSAAIKISELLNISITSLIPKDHISTADKAHAEAIEGSDQNEPSSSGI